MKKILILLVLVLAIIGRADASSKNVKQVIEELVKSMKSGDADAAGILGDLNCDGFTDYDRDTNKALIEKSYQGGSAFGKYSYGSSLQAGRLGFEKNEAEGKRLVTESIPALKEMAENNNAFACLMLYYIYRGAQSNEGENVPESSKWLFKGNQLGNPFCTYYLIKEKLLVSEDEYISDKKNIDDIMENFENLIINLKFPIERIRNLYANVIIKNFKTSKFEHIAYKSDGNTVLNLFRNNRLKCNLFIRYNISDNKYTLAKPPLIYIEYNKNSDINRVNPKTDLKYELDINKISDLLGCVDKIDDWEQKVFSIYPAAFEKCINENRDKQKEQAIVFFWDGICSINYGIGTYGDSGFYAKTSLSREEKTLFLDIFLTAYDVDNDPHSFYKKSQAIILEAVNNQKKKQSVIDENFN